MNLNHALPIAQGKISLASGIDCCPEILFLLSGKLLCIVKNVCVCVCVFMSDCVQTVYELPLLPNNTAKEIFLQNLGAVRSVDWIFLVELPADWANT
jgi:hypothetical protein